MNQSHEYNLDNFLSVFDESIQSNQESLEKISETLKGKPIYRKIQITQASMKSSINQLKDLCKNYLLFQVEANLKTYNLTQYAKQVEDKIFHHPQYQKHRNEYEIFQNNLGLDLKQLQQAFAEFFENLWDVKFLIEPLPELSSEEAIEKIALFNTDLNQRIQKLNHEFLRIKQIYEHLFQYQIPLEKLMHLCGIQQLK